MSLNSSDRFVRDPRGSCHSTERFLLLHHTTQHRRLLGSEKSVCRLLWPWPPLLDHRRRRASLNWFLRSLAGAEPCDTMCPTGQGRGRKLVTEDWKPVGSGRFRDQTRDCFCIPGLVLSLLIQDLPTSVSLLSREVNSRHPCFRSGNVIFPIRDETMNSSFCSQTPKKRERITLPLSPKKR